ncbi:hypothetical protein [Mucilaginibacter sp. L3T2-6]|uniref:hypothetical protein n=1 Tax=Mucilaginibacter sp. L3T2-6 TaxID=3062491 RepID=UPI002675E91A|nr:hypothetical protein [Mucilaginibacter sp. L3T2-6]MDO3645139.1 hypothetical protein [Mucilaginibacter sp. L3T2-6]MDV6217591.1 hypothetical protein [Mucilaginibacter sp. L3T2-6]
MKADEFVDKLKDMAPSIEDYLKIGYSEKLANDVIKSFLIEEKEQNSNYKDELLKLVDMYKANVFEVAIVKFNEAVIEKSNYYLVGEVEADWLILDKITGGINIIELYSEEFLWKCASNGKNFLDALFEVNKFITKTSLDANYKEDQEDVCLMAEECAEQAGGNAYLDFYKMLLGCFE